jgi:hypothetical protein
LNLDQIPEILLTRSARESKVSLKYSCFWHLIVLLIKAIIYLLHGGNRVTGIAGFDCYAYPGDAVSDWLLANTNLQWCGYYLAPTPSHDGTTWMGTRARLSGSGWGIAPIYVGQQVTGPGSLNPSAANGTTDGDQAAALLTSEGFDAGTCVYLDLENGPPLTQAQQDYVSTWCDAVTAGGYAPGIYCSHGIALQAHLLRTAARIWAFNVSTTQAHPVPAPYPDPTPSGCGYIGATAWQLGQHCMLSVPPAPESTLQVDLSSATTPNPGAPAPTV